MGQGATLMKIYTGKRMRVTDPFLGVGTGQHDGWVEHTALGVTVNGQPLDPRLDLANKSPTGFECGYGGSGPHQLALAILADFLHDDAKALSLMHEFTVDVIARLPRDREWQLSEAQLTQWLQGHP
jgi:hypothetical protein